MLVLTRDFFPGSSMSFRVAVGIVNGFFWEVFKHNVRKLRFWKWVVIFVGIFLIESLFEKM